MAAVALAGAACRTSSTTTTPTTTSATVTTDTVSSHLAVGGSATRTFVVKSAGTVRVTLTSLGGLDVALSLGIGIPGGSAPCNLAQSVDARPSSVPHIVTSADPGTYCVQLIDRGVLAGDVPFTVTIEHP